MGSAFSIIILVLMLAVMYFLLIRPQKKREKETNAMRQGVQVGDEIITIGGLCCKVVKTKDETIVVQAGPDKVKFELQRWSVSKVVKEGSGRAKTSADDYDEVADAEESVARKAKPKRMKKAAPVVEEAAEEAPVAEEVVEEAAEEVEEAEEATEE